MGNRYRIEGKKQETNSRSLVSKTRKPCCSKTRSSPVDSVLFLQRTIGNQAVQRLIKSGVLQAKLTIGQAGDVYEKEADSVAKQVVQHQQALNSDMQPQQVDTIPAVSVQKMVQRQETSFPEVAEEELKGEKKVQRKEGDITHTVMPGLEQRLNSRSGFGQSLPQAVQMKMEQSFGASFDRVRLHTDSEAAQISRSLNAEAFTYGSDIYFGANRCDPATKNGTELLAHELTHTLQQNGIRRKAIQCRGGATVGTLSINTNVISAGLTAGHAWLAYSPVGGAMTTYGTWGNRTPIGLHRNLELGYTPAAIRSTALDTTDHTALTTFAAANNAWGYINNCASFAARGWRGVTGESLSYSTIGIPNPSALGAGIVAANGGATGVLPAAGTAARPSSSGSSL
jgi:hypothetical protein